MITPELEAEAAELQRTIIRACNGHPAEVVRLALDDILPRLMAAAELLDGSEAEPWEEWT